MTKLLSACVAALSLLVLAGRARADDKEVTANDLKQIGLAYHNHCDATNKAPAQAKDLAPYLENNKRLLGHLDSGRIVFLYGKTVAEIAKTTGTSVTVLAYEQDVPTRGGQVLMADGSVKKMTADEFKKADKAGKDK
jgi:hypothetical protein